MSKLFGFMLSLFEKVTKKAGADDLNQLAKYKQNIYRLNQHEIAIKKTIKQDVVNKKMEINAFNNEHELEEIKKQKQINENIKKSLSFDDLENK